MRAALGAASGQHQADARSVVAAAAWSARDVALVPPTNIAAARTSAPGRAQKIRKSLGIMPANLRVSAPGQRHKHSGA